MQSERDDLERIEDDFYEDGIADIEETAAERRRKLQRQVREAKDMVNSLENDGPLGKYLQFRRTIARRALQGIVETDPKDAVSIASLQAEIREFLRVGEWVLSELSAADMAEQDINEEFGNSNGQDTDQD